MYYMCVPSTDRYTVHVDLNDEYIESYIATCDDVVTSSTTQNI